MRFEERFVFWSSGFRHYRIVIAFRMNILPQSSRQFNSLTPPKADVQKTWICNTTSPQKLVVRCFLKHRDKLMNTHQFRSCTVYSLYGAYALASGC